MLVCYFSRTHVDTWLGLDMLLENLTALLDRIAQLDPISPVLREPERWGAQLI
jgi:hypothetical protein